MLQKRIIQRTLRVPVVAGPPGDGAAVARQMDAVLLGAGFKASRELLEHLSGVDGGAALDTAHLVIEAVRELVGDHVQHNAYFRDFPDGVPDTVEFWTSCLRDALRRAGIGAPSADEPQVVDLVALPAYGRYRHGYADLLAAHDELIPSLKDRITVVHLGGPMPEEIHRLYLLLAGATVPPSAGDLALLADLAEACVTGEQPAEIPVRENRAVINRARLAAGMPPVADTVTDVLRLACALSGGDVSLAAPTRFRSFTRAERRALLTALDGVVRDAPGKAGDVVRHRERWKRLGERLHPYEYAAHLPHAADVFAVAQGRTTVRSLTARVELAFGERRVDEAVRLMTAAPGMLFRSLDRVLRVASPAEADHALEAVREVAGDVSGRVLLGVREHLLNRTGPDTVGEGAPGAAAGHAANRGVPGAARVFVNREGRAWARGDDRAPLPRDVVRRLSGVLDAEVGRRLPVCERLVVDPAVRDLAVPLSAKTAPGGFGVVPRGSVTPVDGDRLRFFVYWRQARARTDYDLSLLLLDDDFAPAGHVSWTRLRGDAMVHSGDIVEAPSGASEFIDLDLNAVSARYVVPQVNVFAGEGFAEAAESFFGFMTRDAGQEGRPFEPRTVRTKSDLRGAGRVALPLAFARGDDGRWSAHWLHLYVRGTSWRNTVETNRVTTALLARGIVSRRYLKMTHLLDLMTELAGWVETYDPGTKWTAPVTYVGIEHSDALPPGSDVYTLDRLPALIPT